jgi:hypothetical protein
MVARTGGSLTIAPTSYVALSRAPRYSVLFALPLLVTYEGLAAVTSGTNGGLRNGADVLLRSAFVAVAGPWGPTIFIGVVIAAGVWLVARDRRRSDGPLRPRIFAGMLAESMVMAIVFGLVVGTLTARLLGSLNVLAIGPVDNTSWVTRLMLSLGAGLYEELFFRVLLVSAIRAGTRALFGVGQGAAGLVATLLGALVFSAFHYIGAYGDQFTIQSFVFRAISGVAFSALYLTRGFGITAWTHALYDAFLLLA